MSPKFELTGLFSRPPQRGWPTARERPNFTHLNHSNPALDKDDPARKAIEARGVRVAEEGEEIGL
jgi:hypothetical protein